MPKVETERRRIVERLHKEGWSLVRRGSDHDVYRRAGRPGMVALPRHRTISVGTARSIAKQAGWV